MKATVSLLGMYEYFPELFKDLHVPADIDRDMLINNLLLETAELEILYSNPVVLQFAIGNWSNKELPIWNKLLATTKYEYNPIHNYDRTETWTDTRNLRGQSDETRNFAGTDDLSEIPNTTDTSTSKRAGFDSETLHEQDQQIIKREGTTDSNRNTTDTGTGNIKTSDTGTIEHTARMMGNIGVTSTQDMIKQEREVDEFNIVDYITNSFKRRFCLLIY